MPARRSGAGCVLVSGHRNDHRPLAELGRESGISLLCAYKWLARYRSGGVAALADRRSLRRIQRRTLDPNRLQHAVELHHQWLRLRHIASRLAAQFSTVATTALNRLGLGRMRNLEPKPAVQGYERETPLADLPRCEIAWLATDGSGTVSRATCSRAAPLSSVTT